MYIEEMNVCEAHPCCCYLTSVESHWRKCVAAAKKLCKKRKSVWRRRIYRKYVSWKWLRTQDEIYARALFYVGHVVLLANGFPRLNMCASAIFVVGTSGIPPKLNYRSVKSKSPLAMVHQLVYEKVNAEFKPSFVLKFDHRLYPPSGEESWINTNPQKKGKNWNLFHNSILMPTVHILLTLIRNTFTKMKRNCWNITRYYSIYQYH